MKKLGLTTLALAQVLILSFFAASAQATTVHYHHLSVSFSVTNPCTGSSGTVYATINEVMHSNNDSSGGMHFTGTLTGSALEVDTDGINYTGHFSDWFGGSIKNNGMYVASSTLNINAIGTDGSALKYHANDHLTINSNGIVVSNVTDARCG